MLPGCRINFGITALDHYYTGSGHLIDARLEFCADGIAKKALFWQADNRQEEYTSCFEAYTIEN